MSDHEKAARDAVNAEILKGANPPVLAKLICRQVALAARGSHDAKEAVVAAARGGMQGVFLANQDVPGTAVGVLSGLSEISLMSRAGPQELMSWVMEGIAAVAASGGGGVSSKVADAIEERFQGAGEVFSALCDKAARG